MHRANSQHDQGAGTRAPSSSGASAPECAHCSSQRSTRNAHVYPILFNPQYLVQSLCAICVEPMQTKYRGDVRSCTLPHPTASAAILQSSHHPRALAILQPPTHRQSREPTCLVYAHPPPTLASICDLAALLALPHLPSHTHCFHGTLLPAILLRHCSLSVPFTKTLLSVCLLCFVCL